MKMITDPKEVYESLGAVAEALPMDTREEFAVLVQSLAFAHGDRLSTVAEGTRRWATDAGWRK